MISVCCYMKFVAGIFQLMSFCRCHYSSVVEHVIGNDGVASPILANGTIFDNAPFKVLFLYVFQAFQRVRFYRF